MRLAPLVALTICACGTTDFSRPLPAADASIVDAPAADATVDAVADASSDAPVNTDAGPSDASPFDGGPIDCTGLPRTPTFCTTFTNPLANEFQTVGGSQTLQLQTATFLSLPSALVAQVDRSDAGAPLSAAFRQFTGTPTSRFEVSAAFYVDIASYSGTNTAVLLNLSWGNHEVYVDASPSGIAVKLNRAGTFSTVRSASISLLPVRTWTRITLVVQGGSPPRASATVGTASLANADALAGLVVSPSLALQIGLKTVTPPSDGWRVVVDDLVVWAE
jgi:hypothetical protein